MKKRVSIIIEADVSEEQMDTICDAIGEELVDLVEPIITDCCENLCINCTYDIKREKWISSNKVKGDHLLNEMQRQMIVGALDSMGFALTEHEHNWTDGERAIYEQALAYLGTPPSEERAK